MAVKLRDTLIYARGMRADYAAAYLGMGKTKFLELVDKGTMPKAVISTASRFGINLTSTQHSMRQRKPLKIRHLGVTASTAF